MRPVRPLLLILFLAAAGGCDALGGGPYGGGGSGNTFMVVSRTPEGLGVPVGADVVITFNGDIDAESVELGVVTLNGSGYGTLQVDGHKLTFIPPGDLTPGTIYTVSVSADLRGENGHLLGAYADWGFKTAGAPPPPDTLPPSGPGPR
jgi:Big-like domain-containing protein